MKTKILLKRGLSFLMTAALLLSAGCGNSEKEIALSDSSIVESDRLAKGQYSENDSPLPESIDYIYDMKQLEDGTVQALNITNGFLMSSDNGKTWSLKENTFISHLGENPYVTKAVSAKDGSAFLEFVTKDTSDSCYYGFIDANRNFKEIFISETREKKECSGIEILSDGRLIGAFGKTVYEINPDSGKLTKLCAAKKEISKIELVYDILFILTEDDIECFDIKNKKEIKDNVLKSFVKENINHGYASILFAEGDSDDSIFMASPKGIFRHVMGGTVIEEIMKQNHTTLDDPSFYLRCMLKLTDDTFLIAFQKQGETVLKSYQYSDEALAVEQINLTVYSLYEDKDIKQIISDYQKQNKDILIKYNIGMVGQDAVTREDAIRNLNAEILSGAGPDVFVLDELPINSYIEKGILEDLSPVFSNQLKDQEFFENIVNAYKKEDRLFAVSSRFSVPFIMGKAEDLDKINNLSSYTQCIQRLREIKSDGPIIGDYNPNNILQILYNVCAPTWIGEDGTINEDNIVNFLTEAKVIFKEESKFLDESESDEDSLKDFTPKRDIYTFEELSFIGHKQIKYWQEEFLLIMGYSYGVWHDYNFLMTIQNEMNDSTQIKAFFGQGENVFFPKNIIGVNAQSKVKDQALDFASFVIAGSDETKYTTMGYSVNKKVFEESVIDPGEKLSSPAHVIDTADGTKVFMPKWCTDEELEILRGTVNLLDTPAITDSTMRDVVLELGVDALMDKRDIESVANEIVSKLQIYLTE